ncbi:unnamed protein product [Oppiella nova]|uniref:Thyroglobulin type-1 domain-containing protein n=1 Tax=Oppiella nova TaxID=334625 RepID=A0A7R9QUV0_9ACAR|nr:unnamed protein product [Oppiella nova]CAG2175191.1 unnamed protein product [Oppiella nova]
MLNIAYKGGPNNLESFTTKNVIQCEPIEVCEPTFPDEIVIKVDNVTGRGCCPACVHYLNEYDSCKVGSLIYRCRNGLFCNPSTKQCNIPSVDPTQKKCLIEYHNRNQVANKGLKFYIETNKRKTDIMYYPMEYETDLLDMPDCDDETGHYKIKQCGQEKCFCVNPEDGQFTFGLSLKDMAENVTCKCADHFHKKYMGSDGDFRNLEDNAQIHMKCDSAGNFEPLQCVNGTCFCVDEKTGQPSSTKAALYGALQTLPCFDLEKSKKMNTKESDPNYQNGCDKLVLRSESLSLEFLKKGTELSNMGDVTCSYDGRYGSRQCNAFQCFCVNPSDSTLAGNYRIDRSAGKMNEMSCRCALQEFYQTKENLPYSKLQCDTLGNFNPFQCSNGGRECYCVDENGSRISKKKPTLCLDKFMKSDINGLQKEEICQFMRKALSDKAMVDDIYYTVRYNENWDLVEITKPQDSQLYSTDKC